MYAGAGSARKIALRGDPPPGWYTVLGCSVLRTVSCTKKLRACSAAANISGAATRDRSNNFYNTRILVVSEICWLIPGSRVKIPAPGSAAAIPAL